jgi:glucose/arabinose dehydrogenase
VLDGDPIVVGARGQLFRCRPGERAVATVGHLDDPTAAASLPDGAILVVERGAGRVVRVDASGVTGVVADGLHRPVAAARDDDGVTWIACADALVGTHDGAPVRRIDALGGALGVACGPGEVVVAHAPTGRVVRFDVASGSVEALVTGAPITSPVEGATLPHASAPIVRDGAGYLVGCVGDGTVRRLAAAR